MEETLEIQRLKAINHVNNLLKNKEFIESLIQVDDESIQVEEIIEYSDKIMTNCWGEVVKVPLNYLDYWVTIVEGRIGLIRKLEKCKSQFFFEILLKDNYNTYNKLTDSEKELYLNN